MRTGRTFRVSFPATLRGEKPRRRCVAREHWLQPAPLHRHEQRRHCRECVTALRIGYP
jgi:hypothetical protein